MKDLHRVLNKGPGTRLIAAITVDGINVQSVQVDDNAVIPLAEGQSGSELNTNQNLLYSDLLTAISSGSFEITFNLKDGDVETSVTYTFNVTQA